MNNTTQIKVVGIDLAKNVFQIHGRDARGKVVMEKSVKRLKLKDNITALGNCMIAMESCSSSNYWAQEFRRMGHKVKLMAPQHVKPYVQGNKDDRADAAAIAEAGTSLHVRNVSIKEPWQQDILSVLRVRCRMIRQRTAIKNELRSILAEYGIVFAKGWRPLRIGMEQVLGGQLTVRDTIFDLVEELYTEILTLNERIAKYDRKISSWAKELSACKELIKLRGIGPITATALVAIMGNPQNFHNGRHFAAYVGLVPGHAGTGGKIRLGRITKRGDRYLRELLIHCGRSVLKVAKRHSDNRLCNWALKVHQRRGYNKASVAVANKLARQCWAVLNKHENAEHLN